MKRHSCARVQHLHRSTKKARQLALLQWHIGVGLALGVGPRVEVWRRDRGLGALILILIVSLCISYICIYIYMYLQGENIDGGSRLSDSASRPPHDEDMSNRIIWTQNPVHASPGMEHAHMGLATC